MLSHDYTYAGLRYFGVLESLIKNISAIMNSPIAQLSVNGKLTEPFNQSRRGSGQGDPISAYLFLFSIQPLILKLAYSPRIAKPKIEYADLDGQSRTLTLQPNAYADDINVPLDTGNPNNIDNLKDVIKEFKDVSNLALNQKKKPVARN